VGNNGNAAGSLATMAGVLSGTGDLSINGGGFNGTLNLTADNTSPRWRRHPIQCRWFAWDATGPARRSAGLSISDPT
jgi:hypothetical protein